MLPVIYQKRQLRVSRVHKIRMSPGEREGAFRITGIRLLGSDIEEPTSSAKIDLTLRADRLENTDIVRSVRMPNLRLVEFIPYLQAEGAE